MKAEKSILPPQWWQFVSAMGRPYLKAHKRTHKKSELPSKMSFTTKPFLGGSPWEILHKKALESQPMKAK
jgi:hypothetical protein